MKKLLLLIFIVLTSPIAVFAQDVEVVTFEQFQNQELNKEHDKLYVYNFWATWCKPCVKELPYFENLKSAYGDKVEVVLVSLDFIKQLDSKVIPFIKEKGLQSQVLLLNDTRYNMWIDKVSPEWSGSIPATLIVDNSRGVKAFYEMEFDQELLNSTINQYLKQGK